jgi:hypothetical protein
MKIFGGIFGYIEKTKGFFTASFGIDHIDISCIEKNRNENFYISDFYSRLFQIIKNTILRKCQLFMTNVG